MRTRSRSGENKVLIVMCDAGNVFGCKEKLVCGFKNMSCVSRGKTKPRTRLKIGSPEQQRRENT